MLSWLVAFAVVGVPQLIPEGPPVAPVDISPGHQVVDLRAPLFARTAGVRMVLFVRDVDAVLDDAHNPAAGDRQGRFELAVPTGSITAHLTSADGVSLTLEHTGYRYYRGFSGLVLTETSAGARGQLYSHLELDADVALPDVRFVWLDQLTRTVRDVPAPR